MALKRSGSVDMGGVHCSPSSIFLSFPLQSARDGVSDVLGITMTGALCLRRILPP